MKPSIPGLIAGTIITMIVMKLFGALPGLIVLVIGGVPMAVFGKESVLPILCILLSGVVIAFSF
jgi:hypothetical protein